MICMNQAMRTLAAILALSTAALAEEVAVAPLKEGAPGDVAEALRKELAAEGHRITKDGKPYMDFWLRAFAPASTEKAPLGVRFGEIKPWSFVGVVRVHGGASDFKNQKYPAGIFTLRYGIQPEDGDHQGTAESRDFLLLAPASADASPETLGEKEAVKLSSKVNGKKHPIVLWLLPPDEEGKGPRIVKNDMKEHVLFETSIAQGKKDGKPLSLAIVIVGKAAEQ
jgi:hypothetical protein